MKACKCPFESCERINRVTGGLWFTGLLGLPICDSRTLKTKEQNMKWVNIGQNLEKDWSWTPFPENRNQKLISHLASVKILGLEANYGLLAVNSKQALWQYDALSIMRTTLLSFFSTGKFAFVPSSPSPLDVLSRGLLNLIYIVDQ